jgi:hypothetical protein
MLLRRAELHCEDFLRIQGGPNGPACAADAAGAAVLPLTLPLSEAERRTRKLPDTLSRLGIAGGAVYDALAALAAKGARGSPRDPGLAGTRHL